tara:strand:+ start:382 stop:1326 length:945 start_codon:yes stop_codon:yes gene_type:complete
MAFDNAHVMTGGGITAGDGANSHDVFVPEVWAPAIELAFKNKLVWGNLCNDLSAFVANGGDKIHIPKVDQIATGAKTPEAAISYGVDGAAQTELALDINKHTYSATLIEDLLKVQSSYPMMNIYAKEIGYALANSVDDYIESQVLNSFKDASGGINTLDMSGTLNTVAKFDTILTACLAEDQEVSNWTLVLHTSAFADLANFVQLSYATAGAPLGQGFATNGQVSTVFGMPVVMTPQITTASTNMDTDGGTDNQTAIGYVVHKSLLYVAYSQGIRMQADYDIDYLGTKMVGDVIYGCKVNNSSTAGQKRGFFLD